MFRPIYTHLMANYKTFEEQRTQAWESILIAYQTKDLARLKKLTLWLLKLDKLMTIQVLKDFPPEKVLSKEYD